MGASQIARGIREVWRVLVILLIAACVVMALWPGVLEFNAAIRGGIAAFFVGLAAKSLLMLAMRRRAGDATPPVALNSFLVMGYANSVAGILVGAGALWYGGVPGFMAAYAAFSFAWVWWWIGRKVAATPDDQGGKEQSLS
jgi:hypothetical protein